jgi:hypothetical protein
LLIGEAKGHKFELIKNNKTGAKEQSILIYQNILKDVFENYDIDKAFEYNWLYSAFQLGNRIAMNQYLKNKCYVMNYILYILFLNDWKFEYINNTYYNGSDSVKSKEDWMEAFDERLDKLGFNTIGSKQKIKNEIIFVFPDCNQKEQP